MVTRTLGLFRQDRSYGQCSYNFHHISSRTLLIDGTENQDSPGLGPARARGTGLGEKRGGVWLRETRKRSIERAHPASPVSKENGKHSGFE